MTTTYQVKPAPSMDSINPYRVWEKKRYHYDDRYEDSPQPDTEEEVFRGNLADCAAFIQLRKNGHI